MSDWPPDPTKEDFTDETRWMTIKQAMEVAPFYKERAIRALLADYDISLKLGKTRYISRPRYFLAICRYLPKSTG
jgi:hypothetical protein